MLGVLRSWLKSFGWIEPEVRSFETAMVHWINDLIQGEIARDFEGFRELVDSEVKPNELIRELLMAYMHLTTRLSRKHYSSDSAHSKGMDLLHREAYKWFVENAEVDYDEARPFEELLRSRYAEYDIAFSQKDGRALHYFAKTFISCLTDSQDLLESNPLPIANAAVTFKTFVDSSDDLLKNMRSIYPPLKKRKR
ncbi:MAG: hypothetical protein ABII00_09105 [Elusimicrobiota bacterium]